MGCAQARLLRGAAWLSGCICVPFGVRRAQQAEGIWQSRVSSRACPAEQEVRRDGDAGCTVAAEADRREPSADAGGHANTQDDAGDGIHGAEAINGQAEPGR